MDPLTALGLAANIAQFIDFGVKLISESKVIFDAGSSVSVAHLSNITKDLTDITVSLKGQVNSGAFQTTKEEQALQDLAGQCNEVAQELIDSLKKVTLGEKKNRWESVRAALKTIWKKDHFDTLTHQLGEYRQQLSLRLLVLLNSRQAFHDGKTDRYNKEIIEVVSINCRVLRSALEGQYRGEKERQERERVNAERRHEETMMAILTTRDGNSTAITGPKYSAAGMSALSKPDLIRTATTYKQAVEREALQKECPPDFETTAFTSFTKTILDALHFRTIASRRDTIPQAHKATFQWIFRDPEAHDKPWDNFSAWLKSGTGCYWINGKAGSGKSTLMKFLQEDTRTERALREWASSSELVIASFFFWYAGTSLQKSQEGLLRSLLLDVLNRRPELVPILFPDVCRSILAKQLHESIELSYVELQKAFRTFVNCVPAGLKVFFIMDGIDEYDGDPNEISELVALATTSDSVKILLSSRPIPACIHAFSVCRTLRLQDLTRKDVQHYVQDKLGRQPLMQKLEAADKGATRRIIDIITSKASGVLLWVVLVVRSLLGGLQDYDTTADLIQKLDELPPDLERLYDHMLGSMSPQNRRQGSKLLQIVLRSTEMHEDYPITVLQLSFSEDEDYKKAIASPVSALTPQEEDWRCESTEGRMRSRCCGLIEVQSGPTSPVTNNAGCFVDFLHRTVVEFLRTDKIWIQLVALTNGTKFDVNKALLSSSLAEMKAKPPTPEYKEYVSQPCYSMLRMLSYERHMEDVREIFHKSYLKEVKNTMSHYWHEPNLFSSPEMETQAMIDATDRGCSRLELAYPESFLLFAASHCPRRYLHVLFEWYAKNLNAEGPHKQSNNETEYHEDPERDLERDPTTHFANFPIDPRYITLGVNKHASPPPPLPDPRHVDDYSWGRLLDAYLLIQYIDEKQVPLRIVLSRNIMECGYSPNTPVFVPSRKHWELRWRDAVHGDYKRRGWSAWEAALHYSYSITKYDPKEIFGFVQTGLATSHFDIIIAMLDKGADADCSICVLLKGRSSSRTPTSKISALEVLHSFMLKVWSGRTSQEPLTTAGARAATSKLENELAEKACRIESMLKSKEKINTSRGPSALQNSPQHNAAGMPRPAHTLKAIKNNKASKYAMNSPRSASPSGSIKTSTIGTGSKASESRPGTPQPTPSPWVLHKARAEAVPTAK